MVLQIRRWPDQQQINDTPVENMDVTNGLLSKLVKTKSIQRILAPIASQISLLIILNESNDDSALQPVDMVPSAQSVMQAANQLITVAKQQAQSSTDKDLVAQTFAACEVLDLSSSNLYIAAERLEAARTSKEAKNRLVQSSKDVLQGTMKVLMVADDAEIRRIITMTHMVTQRLGLLDTVTSMKDLVHRFQEFTAAITLLTNLADKRQRDLIHARQRERTVSALNVLKKSVSSLSVATQNAVKYSSNPQAQMGKSFVVMEIQSALRDIQEALQDTDTQGEWLEDGTGTFVSNIDQALESLSEENRIDLHLDFETWTEEIIRHSMMVAHLCHDSHRDIIIRTCQKVIQGKTSVVVFHRSLRENPEQSQTREDFNEACECLIDDCCDLEKNVNISLLHLVVEYFKETTQPLERLLKKVLYTLGTINAEDVSVMEFQDHAERVCQIASLAAASSTDSKRVGVIRGCVHRLEHLDPEVIPAVLALSRFRHDRSVLGHLKLLMKEWSLEMSSLLQVLDEMTDPKMFMLVSERKVEDDINTCTGFLLMLDGEGFSGVLHALIGRAGRVAQVAEGIVDSNHNALFRNGLMAYIQQLKKAIRAVRSAGASVVTDIQDKQLHSVMRQRFSELQDSLIRVKAGLNDTSHPHVLSPLRRNVRTNDNTKAKTTKSAKGGRFEAGGGSSLPQSGGMVTTSAPVLREDYLLGRETRQEVPDLTEHLEVTEHMTSVEAVAAESMPVVQREAGVSQGASAARKTSGRDDRSANQTRGWSKSASLSQVSQVERKTYAGRLLQDLITWSTKGDKSRVNRLCADLLGWTNHIADVSSCILKHYSDMAKKRDMESSCFDVDQLAPQLLEAAKYVLNGDFSHLDMLRGHGDDWLLKVEKVRVFVDITVEKWIIITENLAQSASSNKPDLMKMQVDTIQDHQKAICDLISITGALRWEKQVPNQHHIEALWEDKNDLENLSVTLKTTAEMATTQGLDESLVQLEQLGREWAVKLYTAVSALEGVAREMIDMAASRKLWPGLDDPQSELDEILLKENGRLKELLKAATYGDEERKEMSRSLLGDLRDSVEEVKTATIRKRVSSNLVATQYTYLRTGLYRSVWILKAIQCVDLVRQQCSQYTGRLDQLVDKAFHVKQASADYMEEERSELQALITQFSDDVAVVKRKALQGIQLSTELGKRSVVRQCLDTITQHVPGLVQVVRDLADVTIPCDLGGVSWHRLRWAAEVRHLVTTLTLIPDLKSSTLADIRGILESKEAYPDYDEVTEKLDRLPSLNSTPKTSETPTNTASISKGKTKSNDQLISHDKLKPSERGKLNASTKPGSSTSGATRPARPGSPKKFSPYRSDLDVKKVTFEPAVVQLDEVEQQIRRNIRQILKELMDLLNQDRSPLGNTHPQPVLEPNIQAQLSNFSLITHGFGSPAIVASLTSVQNYLSEMLGHVDPNFKKKMDLSEPKPQPAEVPRSPEDSAIRTSHSKPILALLRDAQYIEKQTERWQDDDNAIVRLARTMATQLHHMVQYLRHEGPITSHLGLAQVAKAVAENGEKIRKFVHVIIKHSINESFCGDLKSFCDRLPTVIQQLSVLANVQLGTAQSDTADRMLVETAQNLMKRVLETMTACEVVCMKGLTDAKSDDADSSVVLASLWRRKYIEHRQHGVSSGAMDELGLRVLDEEIMPPTLSQMFRT